MGEQPERRRRRVRPSPPAADAPATTPGAADEPASGTVSEPASETVDGVVAETAAVHDPEPVPARPDPGMLAARGGPAGAPSGGPGKPGGPAGAASGGPAGAASGGAAGHRQGPRPGPAGAGSGGQRRPTSGAGAGAAGQPRATPGGGGRAASGNGGDEPAERGLRGLVGSGSSQVSVGAAMRARDAARPTDEQVAAAERELIIIRRNWVPREDLPRGR